MENNHYTKYELARLIGARALQIGMGAPFLVKLDKADLERLRYNPVEIAKLEFEKGALPMTVKRRVNIHAHPEQKAAA